jgi:4-amino-4-deoxy-L-arabinose transferase-like glycosyltransferase
MEYKERMNSFRVKTEYGPKRCEICHKNDLFDGSLNFCLRCKESQTHTKAINLENESSDLLITEKDSYKNGYDQIVDKILKGSLVFLLAGLCVFGSCRVENLISLSFGLVVLLLFFSGIVMASDLDKKMHRKTFRKFLLAIILPVIILVVFSFIRLVSHLGIC